MFEVLCTEGNKKTQKPCSSPYFSLSCCMGIRRSVVWLGLQSTKRMGAHYGQLALLSEKRYFLCTMRNFEYNCLPDIRILVGRVLHTGTETTLIMSHSRGFSFTFCQVYIVNKRRHYSVGLPALHMFHEPQYSTRDWVVHILNNANYCVRQTWFAHSSITYKPLLDSGPVFTEL